MFAQQIGISLRLLVLTLAAIACGSGCSVMQATKQPGKKDLSVLSPGKPRTHVIAELGAPIWTEERDNGTTDVFVFKQGYTKQVKAARAMGHATMDVVTGGLWEVIGTPAEVLADGRDMKVQVTYDSEYNVEGVNVIQGKQPKSEPREPKKTEVANAKWWRRGGLATWGRRKATADPPPTPSEDMAELPREPDSKD